MRCADCREAVSARLDGEDVPAGPRELDRHLEDCPACRRFADDAARITRLARTGVACPTPDLVPAVLAAAPRPRRTFTGLVRVLLAVVAVGQMGLALGALLAVSPAADQHTPLLGGATIAHLSHETSAWNVAVGAGFLWVALRSTRTAGLVPLLAVFIGLLGVLSVADLLVGRVDPARLLMHGLVVLGFALVVLLDRLRRGGGGRTPHIPNRNRDPLRAQDSADLDAEGPGSTGLRSTAHHRAA